MYGLHDTSTTCLEPFLSLLELFLDPKSAGTKGIPGSDPCRACSRSLVLPFYRTLLL